MSQWDAASVKPTVYLKLVKNETIKTEELEGFHCILPKMISIDEILDSVEMSDVSKLIELGISYTEMVDDNGNKKISFKYEGTRYTVHIIEPKQEKDEPVENENKETVYNDDGSYNLLEYSEDGTLLKTTEYTKDGKIDTIEVYNQDGTQLNYYYDDEERLTTEVTLDNTGYPIHQITYNKDGSISCTYDSETLETGGRRSVTKDANGNLMAVHISNSDGKGIYSEEYENGKLFKITETEYLENGVSRHIEKDPDGNITWIIYWQDDGSSIKPIKNITPEAPEFVEELKILEKTYFEQLDEIRFELISLKIPNPPIASDFKLSSGGIDEEAYNEAYLQYEKEKELYDAQAARLTQELNYIQAKWNQVNKQLLDSKINTAFNEGMESIDTQKSQPNADTESLDLLESELQTLQETYLNNSEQKIQLEKDLQGKYAQIISLAIPTPPIMSDYVLENGEVDNAGYEDALEKYEAERAYYDARIKILEEEALEIRRQVDLLDNYLTITDWASDEIKPNLDALSKVQDLINKYESLGNDAVVAKLKNAQRGLADNIKAQNEMRKQILLMLNEHPQIPKKQDYINPDGSIDESEYDKACGDWMIEQEAYFNRQSNMFKLLENLKNQMELILSLADGFTI